MNMETDILKLSIDWARAEVFSAKISLLLSLLFLLGAIGFWQLGKTGIAKAFVCPMIVAGALIAVVSAGLYLANAPRIRQFESAYNADAKTFVHTEIARTEKSQGELALVLKVLPLISLADYVCEHTFVAGYWDYHYCPDDCINVY